MKIFRTILAAMLLSLGFLPNLTQAEDIDIYTGSPPTGDVNVLFVLDNESNWAATLDNNPPQGAIDMCGANDAGSYFCAQKYALITLLEKVKGNGSYFIPDNVGIGLMMYGAGDNHGSYVRFAVRKMTGNLTSGNRGALIALLRNMPIDDKGSSQQDACPEE